MHLKWNVFLCALLAVLLSFAPAFADYKDDMGYTRLEAALGPDMPHGFGVTVTQVEARTSYNPLGPYMPNATDAQFAGKTLVKKTADSVSGSSNHATAVGRRFYGTSSSLSPAVFLVDCYEANHWFQSGFLNYGSMYLGKPIQPFYLWPSAPSTPSRVANHSWVGSGVSSDVLRRLDFVVETDEFIQVVASDNAMSNKPLMISAFNAISVGKSDGRHQQGSVAMDATYTAGRVKPDLVVPTSPTSYAAPLGASAATLLIETGRNEALSTDPHERHTFNRDGEVIQNAERAEVIKAAMMAGAERVTHNPASANVADYRVNMGNRSPNGLDTRYGAGQVDVYHSYQIIAAGEQNSEEDHPAGQGAMGWYGFDFDPSFGGKDTSNGMASYHFTADQNRKMLYAALVWHMDIQGGSLYDFDNGATLYDLDLLLQDVTDSLNPRLVASSVGTGDNTENLWVPLAPGRAYKLVVSRGQAQAPFDFDYALAWRMTEPPDTDGDRLPDDWEVYYGMGYSDSEEGLGDSGLDTDADTLSDDWEVYYGLSHLDSSDAEEDPDQDGLSNAEEFLRSTDPRNPDTDGDGFGDGIELQAGTNPLDPLSHPDDVPLPALGSWMLIVVVLMLGGLVAATLGTSPKR
jgi:hypothetical protein